MGGVRLQDRRVITCIPQQQCSVRARPRTDSCRCPRTPTTWTPLCWTLKEQIGSDWLAGTGQSQSDEWRGGGFLTFSLLLLQPLPASVDGRHLRLQAQVVLPDLLQLLLQEGDPLRTGHPVQLTWGGGAEFQSKSRTGANSETNS